MSDGSVKLTANLAQLLEARSLLDGAVIATSLLYTSWSLVLGPVFRPARAASSSRRSCSPTRSGT